MTAMVLFISHTLKKCPGWFLKLVMKELRKNNLSCANAGKQNPAATETGSCAEGILFGKLSSTSSDSKPDPDLVSLTPLPTQARKTPPGDNLEQITYGVRSRAGLYKNFTL